MKTRRELEIATNIMQAGKMIHRAGLNCTPEGLYGVDGRRCDCRFDAPNETVFLEIFGGNNLSYIRDRLAMRDSRIFNRRVGKRGHVFHLICNDEAVAALESGVPVTQVQERLASYVEELDHYVRQTVVVMPTEPTKKQYRSVATDILTILGL